MLCLALGAVQPNTLVTLQLLLLTSELMSVHVQNRCAALNVMKLQRGTSVGTLRKT